MVQGGARPVSSSGEIFLTSVDLFSTEPDGLCVELHTPDQGVRLLTFDNLIRKGRVFSQA